MRFFSVALFVCALFIGGSVRAGTPQPMDAASLESQPHLPDTVTPDGMHVGSWSAGAVKTPARVAPQPQASPLQTSQPQTSQSSGPAPQAAQTAIPAAPAPAASDDADNGDKVEPGHSMIVTSIQSCYDQIDPADAADIKKNSLKPYEECQARLQAKLAGKRDLKQGEAQNAATPETPRNYQRVAEPDKADAPANP